MTTFLRITSALALAVWLGAMLFFSMGVAPVAFATLPSRALAGTVVNGSIAKLHVLGYAVLAIALLAVGARGLLAHRKRLWLEAALVGVMLALTLGSGLVVTPPMAEIRARVGAIDSLPADNPDRQRFDWLHQLSVGLMSLNLLVAVCAIALDATDRG